MSERHSTRKKGRPTGSLWDRFYKKFKINAESGCWVWTAKRGGSGRNYGQIRLGTKLDGQDLAHRVSYRLHVGQIPEGSYVLHRCDNGLCVNPAHLFLGTAQDNTSDMISKGRRVMPATHHGSSKVGAKLSEDAVRHILRREMSARKYAALYGVHHSTVAHVWRGRGWRHVERT